MLPRVWLVALACWFAGACARSEVVRAHAARSPGDTPDVKVGLFPAGLCGFDPYNHAACSEFSAPRFAVVIPAGASEAEVTDAVRRGQSLGLPAGYPFAVTYDDLPAKDAARRGLAVVAGLFGVRALAENYAQNVGAPMDVVALASPDEAWERWRPPPDVVWEDFARERSTAVELASDAPAHATEAVEKLEAELGAALGERWVPLSEQLARRRRRLAELSPRCTLRKGRVFVVSHNELYTPFGRAYAPARCPDGSRVLIDWTATRLESIVTRSGGRAKIHQVVNVECDQASVEVRWFEGSPPGAPVALALGGSC